MTGRRHRGLRPAPELVAFAEHECGPVAAWRDASWEHAESEVWEAQTGEGRRIFLKHHRRAGKFRQELHAYREWTPGVGECPELLAAHREEPRALLLSAIEGGPLLQQSPDGADEQGLYRRAGDWLRRFHGLGWSDDDALQIPAALTKRSSAWSERSRGVLADALIDEVHAQVSAPWPSHVAVPRRVPCHRDYTARNWLVNGAESFAVIDFEHARPDWSMVDLERVRSSIPSERDELWSAFLVGYGLSLDLDHQRLLRRLQLHAALSRVVWAVEHADVEFERLGREQLSSLLG